MSANQVTSIDHSHLEKMLADAPPRNDEPRRGRALVNVLDERAFEEEHVPGSINIPVGREDLFEERYDKGKEIVVYADSAESGAARRVAEELVRRGFRRVVGYEAGLRDWKASGHDTEGRAPQATRRPGGPPVAEHHVTGAFDDPDSAERAVRALLDNHFAPEEIGVIVKDRTGIHEQPLQHRTGVGYGGLGGAAIGVALGGMVGALASIGILPAPDIAFFHTEPLVAALKSAAAGGFAGFVFGALAGLESWRDEVGIDPETLTDRGGVLVSVPARNERAALAREALAGAGATSVQED